MRKVIIDDLPYKKISLGVCTKCNTEKFHCINDDGSIDFITLCECEIAKENKERSKKLTNSIYIFFNSLGIFKFTESNIGFVKCCLLI